MIKVHYHNLNLFILFLAGCGSALSPTIPPKATTQQKITTQQTLIITAENTATPAAHAVLKQVRLMAENGEIIRGGCWDYLNIAWKKAGVPVSKRKVIFKGNYPHGPFANSNTIQAGDWLYFVNHSYKDIEHSGMFIAWTNKPNHEALIFSYAGEHRQTPARYRIYKIDQTYRITRATQ